MAKRIVYLGIYRPTAPRDKNLVEGLRAHDVEVVELVSSAPGFQKYLELWKRHKTIGQYDTMVLGYLSTYLAPLARLLSRSKKLIFNAGNPIYDGLVTDRGIFKEGSLRARLVWWADWLAFKLSDIVLLESGAQMGYVAQRFGVAKQKLVRTWTGADQGLFFPDETISKKERFTAVFRGFFVPATGVEIVLETAKLLKGEDVGVRLIGRGPLLPKVESFVQDNSLSNVEVISRYLEPKEMRTMMLEGHVLLGQFGGHERLERTIQHKTFEALALGMPYVTSRTHSNEELFSDGETVLFANDAQALAKAILGLKHDQSLRERLGANARNLFIQKCTPSTIVEEVLGLL